MDSEPVSDLNGSIIFRKLEYPDCVPPRVNELEENSCSSSSSEDAVKVTSLIPPLKDIEPVSGSRFVALFNLGLRYWDEGRVSLALRECIKARDFLLSVGLPAGCAEHTVTLMQEKMRIFRAEELDLLALVNGKKKNSIDYHYRLGTIYFDRRMLKSAEMSLCRASELAIILNDMETIRKQAALSAEVFLEGSTKWPYCNKKKLLHNTCSTPSYSMNKINHTKKKLEAISQDLDFVQVLKRKCLKNGYNRLLPCLRNRFAADDEAVCDDCEEWGRVIRRASVLTWKSND